MHLYNDFRKSASLLFEPLVDNKHPYFILAWMILLSFLCWPLANLIPPIQSPDEEAHLTRAYALAHGEILQHSVNGFDSGSFIDSGLLKFMTLHFSMRWQSGIPYAYETKLEASKVEWTGKKAFSPSPGTSNYFPLVYLPQAIALFIGENLHLSVLQSYWLARIFNFLATIFIILRAFRIYKPNFLTIGILILPMFIFQALSTTIDGFSTSLLLLFLASSGHILQKKEADNREILILGLLLFSFISSRLNMLPVALILLLLWRATADKKLAYTFFFTLLPILIWSYIASKTTLDSRVKGEISHSIFENAHYWLHNPQQTMNVLSNTFSNEGIQRTYNYQLVGVLGWLDTYFQEGVYQNFLLCLKLLALLSIKIDKDTLKAMFYFIFISLLCVILIFILLLFVWTTHNSLFVQGVQGRYFIQPLLIVAFALSLSKKPPISPYFPKISLALLFFMLLMDITKLPPTLIDRYSPF